LFDKSANISNVEIITVSLGASVHRAHLFTTATQISSDF
jgi:hypothetical protein